MLCFNPSGRTPGLPSRFLLLGVLHSMLLGSLAALVLESHLKTELSSLYALSEDLFDESVGRSWSDSYAITRQLDGTGFHKTLKIQVQTTVEVQAELAACKLSLLQVLSSSTFADPYQLQDITRRPSTGQHAAGHNYTFQLLGPLDLELPAPACSTTALLLTFWLSQHPDQEQQEQQPDHARQRLSALLSVPLHAKYPQPQAFGYQGWSASITGHVEALLPWPWLIKDCRGSQGGITIMPPPEHLVQQEQQWQLAKQHHEHECSAPAHGDRRQGSNCNSASDDSNGSEVLRWSVPAGNLDHSQLVSWATLIVTAACCLAVSWKAIRVKLQ